jgi:hypothetical protein
VPRPDAGGQSNGDPAGPGAARYWADPDPSRREHWPPIRGRHSNNPWLKGQIAPFRHPRWEPHDFSFMGPGFDFDQETAARPREQAAP